MARLTFEAKGVVSLGTDSNGALNSDEPYVWPSAFGHVRGHGIVPLYPKAVDAATRDPELHEVLALIDALRVGRARERTIAADELKKRIC